MENRHKSISDRLNNGGAALRPDRLTTVAVETSTQLLSSILEAMDRDVVVTTGEGVMLCANHAGRIYRYEDLPRRPLPGTNYIAALSRMGSADDAEQLKRGLNALHDGSIARHRQLYTHQTDNQPRRVELVVFRMSVDAAEDDRTLLFIWKELDDESEDLVQQQRLTARILSAQDHERRRIARDLHDSTAQDLFGAQMSIRRLKKRCDQTADQALVTHAETLLERAQNELRAVAWQLHPPALEEVGLAASISDYCAGFELRSGLRITIGIESDLSRINAEKQLVLYRVLQEALSNVHRHARAANVGITMADLSDHRLLLTVCDDGHGFSAECRTQMQKNARSGIGIVSMRARLRELGGSFAIRSHDTGTCVQATLPFDPEEPSRDPSEPPVASLRN